MNRLYKVREVAQNAGIHQNLLWRMIWNGVIPHYKLLDSVRGAVRLAGPDVVELLREREVRPSVIRKFGRNTISLSGRLKEAGTERIRVDKDVYTFSEIAEILSVSTVKSVGEMVGHLAEKGVRQTERGPLWINVIDRQSLEEWLESRKRIGRVKDESRTHH